MSQNKPLLRLAYLFPITQKMKYLFLAVYLFSFTAGAQLGVVPAACIPKLDLAIASYKKVYAEALTQWKAKGFTQKDLDYYIVFYVSRNDWPGGYDSPIKKRLGIPLTDRLKGSIANAQGNASFCKITEIKKYKQAHPELSQQQVLESDDIRDIYGQSVDYFYNNVGINFDLLTSNSESGSPRKKSATKSTR
jgi:hypothetical protein